MVEHSLGMSVNCGAEGGKEGREEGGYEGVKKGRREDEECQSFRYYYHSKISDWGNCSVVRDTYFSFRVFKFSQHIKIAIIIYQ